MTLLDVALITGLTARLTRFVVYDDAGALVRTPIVEGARVLASTRGMRLARELLACPFCIGWWIALGVAGSWHYSNGMLWQAFAAAGTASYVVGHVAARVDDEVH